MKQKVCSMSNVSSREGGPSDRRRPTRLRSWESIFGRHPIFRLARQLFALNVLLLSGCGAIVGGTIATANSLDQAATRKLVAGLRAQQIAQIKSLQAQGDPMGDYLFALANAEGWIGENRISDPMEIKDLYQKAANKGSSDAMIALGLMLFDGRGAPQYAKGIYLPYEQQNWKRGLEWVERGMKIRCSYAQPLYIAITPPGRQCLVYRSPASWIWPAFRDGKYRWSPEGKYVPVIEKNQKLQEDWRAKDAICNATPEMQSTKRDCQMK
ncbi:hypothetical protein ACIP1U_32210 [Cupriavidus sp. NPDC089707]|uniref:hypothetical protein n=1 Tax=Cupriavidus sp. NPDC089707 TaxID=3363963 RepID=UPI00382DE5C4